MQKEPKLLYEDETYKIRGAIFKIYKEFRNTHKEIVYHNSLYEELKIYGYKVEKNKQIPIYYNSKKVGTYTPDLIINDKIIIELKAKPNLLKSDTQQFWHYLKNSGYRLGFLVNFGASGGVQIYRRIYG